MKTVLGIDIGGTNTKLGLVNEKGEILKTTSFPTNSERSFEDFLLQIKKEIDSFKSVFEAIGIGAPNANSESGQIENPPNLKWRVAPVVSGLKKYFSKPIVLENDANMAACGEKKFGLAKDLQDFVVITLGTGIGTGIFCHNHLITGFHSVASEGGHLQIFPEGRNCHCGGFGHLEAYASVRGIKLTTKEVTDKDLLFREIAERFEKNEKDFVKIFEMTADFLARGLAQMQTLLAPESFILAGGVANVGEPFRKRVASSLKKYSYPPFKDLSKVEISRIQTQNGAILGAAALVL